MNKLSLHLAKWYQTIITSIARTTAYKLDFILQVLGPSLFFFFIKYNLWTTVYSGQESLEISGFTLEKMLQYQVWVLVCEFLVKSQTASNLSEEIRMGRISNYLIYPFSFWKFHFANFLGFQIVQSFTVAVTMLILLVTGVLSLPTGLILIKGLMICYLVSTLWFNIQFLTGVMGFWLEETWIVRVALDMITLFLSGSFVPLTFFPEWLQKTLIYSPFPYMISFPVKIFMGEPVDWKMAFIILSFWLIFFRLLGMYVWRRGLKLYTAAGM